MPKNKSNDSRILYLTKVIIRNFRSIEELEISNIGDVTIFIGPNESGKSNILQALRWFGTSEKLRDEDVPVGKSIGDNDVIVEAYFKIVDENSFKKSLEERLNDKLLEFTKDGKISLEGLNFKPAFLRIQKFANGNFSSEILDDTTLTEQHSSPQLLKAIKDFVLENMVLAKIFDKCLREGLKSLLLSNNIPDSQLPEAINVIYTNTTFKQNLKQFLEEFAELDKRDFKSIEELKSTLKSAKGSLLSKVPNTTFSVTVFNRAIQLNPDAIASGAFNRMENVIKDLFNGGILQIIRDILLEFVPDFVYLSEEMELKGSVRKINSWSRTLIENNKDYAVNARLFSVLDIDLEKFDKMPLQRQDLELRNKLIQFSKKLEDKWKQLRVRITHNISPDELNLRIEEVDENGYPIKATAPESRSRGFKWFLAYVITLEYLSKKGNCILLLDDPAVFLHEKGQSDFLETIEEVSKKFKSFMTLTLSLFLMRKN